MVVKNTLLGGTDFSTPSDRVKPTDLNDTFNAVVNNLSFPWNKFLIPDSNINQGLIKWTDIRWQTEGATTTDGGDNWSAGGYTAETAAASVADNSGTNGVAIEAADETNSSYSTDSGATWNASSTDPALDTAINDISIFGSQAVVCGDDSSSKNINFSSDGGDNWTPCTTNLGVVNSIVMISSTVGYATVTPGNIWKTTDGGDNWVWTNDFFDQNMYRLFAIDTDTLLAISSTGNDIQKYVNSTNTVTNLFTTILDVSLNSSTNIVQATNGNFYFVFSVGADGTNLESGNLNLLMYDGTNIFIRPLMISYNKDMTDGFWFNSSGTASNKPVLIEVDNKLYLNYGGDQIMEVTLEL